MIMDEFITRNYGNESYEIIMWHMERRHEK